MTDTPETDAFGNRPREWPSFARRLERERDAALAREAALLEFMDVEMGWEYFRAEYNIGDNPSHSLQNAKKVRDFLDQHK